MNHAGNHQELLFHPRRMEIPSKLVLVPQFPAREYYQELKDRANRCFDMNCDFLFFDEYTVICGFMGYPHILALLEFIDHVRDKEIYFLGTAGSLNETYDAPISLAVTEIHSCALLDHFCPHTSLPLTPHPDWNLESARGVSVDIIQRETPAWLRQQKARHMDFVEMELFPLRAYLEKAFHAIIVTSDLLTEKGIHMFTDRKALVQQFLDSFELIIKTVS